MNSYLDIAQLILREERRPLSARSILRLAYQQGHMATHLFGKTQHKTLQARLSEDILHRRERSSFFRTEPGKFFLREFISDPTIPAIFRREMKARRRTRDLLRGPALAVAKHILEKAFIPNKLRRAHVALTQLQSDNHFQYVEPKALPCDLALVWSVAAVRRDRYILTYRTGRYRDNRDSFAQRRSICFAALVLEDDQTLFDAHGLGIVDAALTAVSTDLNVPVDHKLDPASLSSGFSHQLKCLLWEAGRTSEVLAFVEVLAPDWFEPAQTRLSINDLRWMDLDSPPNNIDDFDPWSRSLLQKCFNCWADYGNESRDLTSSSA